MQSDPSSRHNRLTSTKYFLFLWPMKRLITINPVLRHNQKLLTILLLGNCFSLVIHSLEQPYDFQNLRTGQFCNLTSQLKPARDFPLRVEGTCMVRHGSPSPTQPHPSLVHNFVFCLSLPATLVSCCLVSAKILHLFYPFLSHGAPP